MELNELIRKRRSIRAYKDERVKKEDIEAIAEAAIQAPSWKNSQTARIYAAVSDEAIASVYEALPEFNRRSSKNAAYLVTTFVRGSSGLLSEERMAEEGDLWGSYDLGLNNAYLLLKATELGYDTLIMGIRDAKALRDYFAIPEEEIVMAVIAIGKGDQDPAPRPRKQITEILKIR